MIVASLIKKTSIWSFRFGGLYSTSNTKVILSISVPTIVAVPASPAPSVVSGVSIAKTAALPAVYAPVV